MIAGGGVSLCGPIFLLWQSLAFYSFCSEERAKTMADRVFRARRVRKHGIGGEARHGATSSVTCETSLDKHVTPHLHMGYGTSHYTIPYHTIPYHTITIQCNTVARRRETGQVLGGARAPATAPGRSTASGLPGGLVLSTSTN